MNNGKKDELAWAKWNSSNTRAKKIKKQTKPDP
jgi:hypothetical protein